MKKLKVWKTVLVGLLAIAAISLALLVWAVNYGFLKPKIENKLSQSIGARVRYKSISLREIDKITLHNLTIGNHSEVKKIIVDVDMAKSISQKELIVDAVNIERPSFKVDLDAIEKMLLEAAKRHTELPTIAQNKALPKSPLPTEITKPKPLRPKPVITKKPPLKEKPPIQDIQYPKISITKASIALKSKRLPEAVSLETFAFQLDGGLKQTEGMLSFNLSDHNINLTFPVLLDGRKLSFPKHTQSILGFECTSVGEFGLVRALPFSLNLTVNSANPINYHMPNDDMLSLMLNLFQSQLSARGALANPDSLQAAVKSDLEGLTLTHKTRGEQHFETGALKARINKGHILLPKFSLQSEEVNILGNGKGRLNEFNFIARVIANDEWANTIAKLAKGLYVTGRHKVFSGLIWENLGKLVKSF